MFLIRLILRLALLLFLFVAVMVFWNEKDWMTRSMMIVISVLLLVGIYALRYLVSLENSKYATGSNPSMAWQLVWSKKTPFAPKILQAPSTFEDSGPKPFLTLMSLGLHIVCARLIPMAISLVSVWAISRVVLLYWDLLVRLIPQVLSLEQSAFGLSLVGMALYLFLYILVQRFFMSQVAVRCMAEGCSGHAFLSTEAEGHGALQIRKQYQFVYVCREHNHRLQTGVQSFRGLWSRIAN
jgi:hypothetical protein